MRRSQNIQVSLEKKGIKGSKKRKIQATRKPKEESGNRKKKRRKKKEEGRRSRQKEARKKTKAERRKKNKKAGKNDKKNIAQRLGAHLVIFFFVRHLCRAAGAIWPPPWPRASPPLYAD